MSHRDYTHWQCDRCRARQDTAPGIAPGSWYHILLREGLKEYTDLCDICWSFLERWLKPRLYKFGQPDERPLPSMYEPADPEVDSDVEVAE